MSCWETLDIAPTGDERSIKRAYAKLLKVTRAEDDAAAFQQLRDAYEMALKKAPYVRAAQAQDDADAQEASTSEMAAQTDNVTSAHQTTNDFQTTSDPQTTSAPEKAGDHQIESDQAANEFSSNIDTEPPREAHTPRDWRDLNNYDFSDLGVTDTDALRSLIDLAITLVTTADEEDAIPFLNQLFHDQRLQDPNICQYVERVLVQGFNDESECNLATLAKLANAFGWDLPTHPLSDTQHPGYQSFVLRLNHAIQLRWYRLSQSMASTVWTALKKSEAEALAEFDAIAQSTELLNFTLREMFEEKMALVLASATVFPKLLARRVWQFFGWEAGRIPHRELSHEQRYFLDGRFQAMDQLAILQARRAKLATTNISNATKYQLTFLGFAIVVFICTYSPLFSLLKVNANDVIGIRVWSVVITFILVLSFYSKLADYLALLLERLAWHLIFSPARKGLQHILAFLSLSFTRSIQKILYDIKEFHSQAFYCEIDEDVRRFWLNKPIISPKKNIFYFLIGAVATVATFLSLKNLTVFSHNTFVSFMETPLFFCLLTMMTLIAIRGAEFLMYFIRTKTWPPIAAYDRYITEKTIKKIIPSFKLGRFRIIKHVLSTTAFIALFLAYPPILGWAISLGVCIALINFMAHQFSK